MLEKSPHLAAVCKLRGWLIDESIQRTHEERAIVGIGVNQGVFASFQGIGLLMSLQTTRRGGGPRRWNGGFSLGLGDGVGRGGPS